jgi:type II secretory pathway pseudopilin PulG
MRDARGGRQSGFTTIELIVVGAILAALAAATVPSWRTIQANNRLRDAAGDVADALAVARARAVASGHRFVVYFNTGLNAGQDICGNVLEDANGNPVPILILDDGLPFTANYNCCIDANEPVQTLNAAPGVQWGTDFAAASAPGDSDPSNSFTTGVTFTNTAGAQTEWVAFAPDGVPVGFTDVGATCSAGGTGSGGGAIYVNNDRRDVAVVLSPLGGVKTYQYERSGATWHD